MQTGGIEEKSKVIGRDEQAAMCTKSRSAVADGEAVGFSCRLPDHGVKVEFAWVTWFSNENASAFIPKSDEKNAGEGHRGIPTYLPDDICSHGPDTTAACLRKFLKGSSERDSLYMMLGHNYPFDGAPSPTEPERRRFLDAVRASFRGSMVFSLATAVYGEFGEDPVWQRQLPEVNAASRDFLDKEGIPLIDPRGYCNNETRGLYEDRIHHGTEPGGRPGPLTVAHIKLLSSIVAATKREKAALLLQAGQGAALMR